MTSFSTLSLYSLTVKQPTFTVEAVAGDFIGTGKGDAQILTANGSRLSLLQVTRRQTGLQEVYSQDVFGIIRRIAKFRLAGATKDHIVVSTDSGRLVTYEYMPDEQQFKTVHFETFGKSGVRRVVPGEYLAVDPKGRAIMVASTEKNKLVYILTRSGQTDIAISSPLEAHKPQTLMYSLVGLDVGYDNPMFAALELDFSSAETDTTGEAVQELKKDLVYYELDLGLNHIVRKSSEPVDRTANILFRAPGGPNAPGGVLVCGEDNITYHRIFNKKSEIHRLAIPRREGATEDPNRKRTIVSGTLFMLKAGDHLFLLQTDDGDLFKLKIEPIGSASAERITIKYYDTIPLCTSICILKSGFVYAACESGDRVLYELEGLAEGGDDPVWDSTQFPIDPAETFAPPFFKPHALVNLSPVENVASLNPIMDLEVANLALEDAPQIYTINGAGGRSSFRTTKNALEVLDLIESPLPHEPSGVWTTKLTSEDDTDTLIVMCLHSKTLVLKIGDDVEEASNTGFLLDTNTIGVQQFGEDCVIQIHPKGIRHIQGIHFENEDDTTATHASLTDWQAPAHRTIVACATNNRQVAIALSSGQILYFECDQDGSLAMAEEEIALDSTITSLAIPDVPEGSVRAFFMAVGCNDNTVRVYNLSPDMEGNILRSISVQGTSSAPSDLTINSMTDKSARGYSQFLHIGLRSGVYIRSVLDEMTGEIGNTRRRFLGPEPIKFTRIIAAGEPAVLAMTSRPWLAYTHPRTSVLQLTPLNYIPFKSAWNFEGSAFKGVICVSATDLRIFTFNDLLENTTFEQIPLKYTPRKFVGYHDQGTFFVIESEANTMDAGTRQQLINQASDAMAVEKTNGDTSNGHSEGDELSPAVFGYPTALGQWASCIQIVDPVTDKTVVHTVELSDNKNAVSIALVTFEGRGDEKYLAVGTAKDLRFTPYAYTSASIQLYKVSPDGRQLEFMHETEVSEPPLAMIGFKGKLVVGSGQDLALYECGMRSILRKALTPNCVPTRIVGIKTQGSRIIVSDQTQSVTYVVHKDSVHPNRLIPFADDTIARHTSCTEMVDYETVVGGDKFGNIWLVRCPPKVSEAADESPDGLNLLQDKAYLGGAPNRLDLIAHYFANDIPTSMQRTVLLSGGEKVIFWAGLQGTLGALIPFSSRRQHKMFQQLELLLRNDDKPLSGRDHLAFRSYYTPVKSIIDGDLIERFLVLSRDKREQMVGQLNGAWSSEAVDESIWNMRGLYAF